MARADSDGERIDARLFDELLNFRRIGELRVLGADVDRVFDTGQLAQLALDDYAALMRIFDDAARQLDIVPKRMLGTVDHDGGKAAVDAGFADFKILAVVEVDANRQIGVLNRGFNELHQINVLGVFSRAGRNLQDNRGFLFLGGLGDTLDDLHVVDVEGADGVAALVSLTNGISFATPFFIQYWPDKSLYAALCRL